MLLEKVIILVERVIVHFRDELLYIICPVPTVIVSQGDCKQTYCNYN